MNDSEGRSSVGPGQVQLELHPSGRRLTLAYGDELRDPLFAQGVEFPCGGRGRCRGCRIRILGGELAITSDDRARLSDAELADGWRLACQARARGDIRIELAQWEAAILGDATSFAFNPRPGLGVAVDLGTTTVVAQLLDLETARVLAVRSALNRQAQHGADIMSRVDFAVNGGLSLLTEFARQQIGGMISGMLAEARLAMTVPLEVMVVGNTVMHHLFAGYTVDALAQHPFESTQLGSFVSSGEALGWMDTPQARVRFLPCFGGFVGSDLLAGVLATGLQEATELSVLIDLGTNGEMVLGKKGTLLCASTAAGPAFEGARISCGMRAATGAISEVNVAEGRLQARVLGHGEARGLCGSGLVDAVAGALDLKLILPSGRFSVAGDLPLADRVHLKQTDVRELQLAKGAITAGVRLLAQEVGAGLEDIQCVYLAGAFGNCINRRSARRIGLLPFPLERIRPVGNSALLGAKQALFLPTEMDPDFGDLRRMVKHVSLNDLPTFHDDYVMEMGFPGETPG